MGIVESIAGGGNFWAVWRNGVDGRGFCAAEGSLKIMLARQI